MACVIFSGHYVPQLAKIIYEKNKGIQNPILNLKGFVVNI
jgi:serine carboxypeptidase-like clade 2